MQRIRKCSEHKNYMITAICTRPDCRAKRLICLKCMKNHKTHDQPNDIRSIDQFFELSEQRQYAKNSSSVNALKSAVKTMEIELMQKISNLMEQLVLSKQRALKMFKSMNEMSHYHTQSNFIQQVDQIGYTNIEQEQLNKLIDMELKHYNKEMFIKEQTMSLMLISIKNLKDSNVEVENVVKELERNHEQFLQKMNVQPLEVYFTLMDTQIKETLRASVFRYATILSWKGKVQELLNEPHKKIRLEYNGKILKDWLTFGDYDIQKNSILRVYPLK